MTAAQKMERGVLRLLLPSFKLRSKINMFHELDLFDYERFGRLLQSMRRRGLIETPRPHAATWRITDLGRTTYLSCK
jgi:hypothetical protein